MASTFLFVLHRLARGHFSSTSAPDRDLCAAMFWTRQVPRRPRMPSKTTPPEHKFPDDLVPLPSEEPKYDDVDDTKGLGFIKFNNIIYGRLRRLPECVPLRPRSTTRCSTTVAEDPCNASLKFDYPHRAKLPSTPSYSDSSSSYPK
ncbi:hypothetical protein VPH35_082155 [Triticum aestivum]